jgi:hypothetical protein
MWNCTKIRPVCTRVFPCGQKYRHDEAFRSFANVLKNNAFFAINVCFILIFFFVIAVCSENCCLSQKYHVGLWNGKRWTCCRINNRSADGCESCTSWSRTPPTLVSIGLIKNDSVELINNSAATPRLTGMTPLGFALRKYFPFNLLAPEFFNFF